MPQGTKKMNKLSPKLAEGRELRAEIHEIQTRMIDENNCCFLKKFKNDSYKCRNETRDITADATEL